MTKVTEYAADVAATHWDSVIIGLCVVALMLMLVLTGCLGRVTSWFEERLE